MFFLLWNVLFHPSATFHDCDVMDGHVCSPAAPWTAQLSSRFRGEREISGDLSPSAVLLYHFWPPVGLITQSFQEIKPNNPIMCACIWRLESLIKRSSCSRHSNDLGQFCGAEVVPEEKDLQTWHFTSFTLERWNNALDVGYSEGEWGQRLNAQIRVRGVRITMAMPSNLSAQLWLIRLLDDTTGKI